MIQEMRGWCMHLLLFVFRWAHTWHNMNMANNETAFSVYSLISSCMLDVSVLPVRDYVTFNAAVNNLPFLLVVLVKQITQREKETSGQQLAIWRLAASQLLQTFILSLDKLWNNEFQYNATRCQQYCYGNVVWVIQYLGAHHKTASYQSAFCLAL